MVGLFHLLIFITLVILAIIKPNLILNISTQGITIIVFLIIWIISTFLCYISISISPSNKKKLKKVRNINKNKIINYNRDIPCDNDLFKLYWFMYQYDLSSNKSSLFGAYILNLINMGKAKLINNDTIEFDFDNISSDNEIEIDLIAMLYEACPNKINLNKSDLKKYILNNSAKIKRWENKLYDFYTNKYKHKKLIYYQKNKLVISEKLNLEAIKILEFKKFLIDFANIRNKEPIEVELYNEYIIFGFALGLTDVINKNLKNFIVNNEDLKNILANNFLDISLLRGIVSSIIISIIFGLCLISMDYIFVVFLQEILTKIISV